MRQEIVKLLTTNFETGEFKRYLADMVEEMPEYFFTMPSSTSGRHHNKTQCRPHGQLYHVFMFQSILEHRLRLKHNKELYPTPEERDAMRCVPLLHDAVKCGWGDEFETRWTKPEHPMLAKRFVLDTKVKHDIPAEYKQMIADMCEAHSGEWNKDRSGRVIMSEPRNEREFFIHECDILASREDLDWIISEELQEIVGRDMGGYVMPMGKYRGEILEDVMKKDPQYVRWLLGSEWSDKYPRMKEMLEFVVAEADDFGGRVDE